MKCPTWKNMVLAFAITAAWDVLLRLFAEQKIKLFGIENISWVKALEKYFEEHTVLAAALIAGFVGAVAYVAIAGTVPDACRNNILCYTFWIAFVSAIIGIPMRFSNVFPHLKKHYYDRLPVVTIFSDALSGVIVAGTMFAMEKLLQ